MKRVWIGTRERKSGTHYFIGWMDGARVRLKIVGTRKRTAEHMRLAKWRELNGLPDDAGERGRGVTWDAFVGDHLADVAARRQPNTVDKRRRVLAKFAEICEPTYLAEIDAAMVRRFRTARLKDVKPASVDSALRELRAAFNIAVADGLMADNPVKSKTMMLHPDKKPIRVLTPDEETALVGECRAPWLRLFVSVGLDTGTRLSELLALRWRDVHLGGKRRGHVYVRSDPHVEGGHRTKTGKARWVSVSDETLTALVGWNRDSDGPLVFEAVTRWMAEWHFRKAVTAAKIDHTTIHDLRRTCATRLAEGGMLPATLRAYMGHSSIATTMTYYVNVEARATLDASAVARANWQRMTASDDAGRDRESCRNHDASAHHGAAGEGVNDLTTREKGL